MSARPMTVSDAEVSQAVARARSMFQRVLGQWACDVLALQRDRRDAPTWNGETGHRDRRKAA